MYTPPPGTNLDDPSVDTTMTCCGNSPSFIEDVRREYTHAFSRAMEYACREQLPGDVMEFGVYYGFTSRIFAEAMIKYRHKGDLHLFDSFEGFPASDQTADQKSLKVAVQKYWEEGKMPMMDGVDRHIFERLSPVLGQARLHIHKGFFDKTMPRIVSGKKATIVHIDSDLYASAKYVLDTLNEYECLQDGTVLLFDDWFCNRANPNFGEQAAVRDFIEAHEHYALTPWFTYSWGAAAFFLHDKRVTDQTRAQTAPGHADRPLPGAEK